MKIILSFIKVARNLDFGERITFKIFRVSLRVTASMFSKFRRLF